MDSSAPGELGELLPYVDEVFDSLKTDESDDTVQLRSERTRNSISLSVQEGGLLPSLPIELPKGRRASRRISKTSLVPYSTNLQRRKKAELRDLRLEAQQLSAKLENLLSSRVGGEVEHTMEVVSGQHEPNKWRSQAMIECEERVRAERTNREMKVILSRQFKIFQCIRRLLGHRGVFEGRDFIERLCPTADRPFFQIDFTDPVLSGLASNLQHLYLQADAVLPSPSDGLSVGFHTHDKRRTEEGGCFFEINVTTPLACHRREAEEILWGYITNKDNGDIEKSFDFAREQRPRYSVDACETSCIASLVLQDPNGTPLYVDAVSTFRKYDERSRVVLVGSMAWLHPTEGQELEANYWSIIAPSPINAIGSSLIRTCYRLQVKNAGIQSATSTQKVMACIGKQVRSYLQIQQDTFLEKANPVRF